MHAARLPEVQGPIHCSEGKGGAVMTIFLLWWFSLSLAFAMGAIWARRPHETSQPSFEPTPRDQASELRDLVDDIQREMDSANTVKDVRQVAARLREYAKGDK